MMQDMVINDYINHLEENKELFDLLKYQKLVGSLAIGDQFEANEIKWFLQISEGVENNAVTGSEDFPGEFLSKAPNEPSLYPARTRLDSSLARARSLEPSRVRVEFELSLSQLKFLFLF